MCNPELHSWSRHYDTILWTVTAIFASADSGLLIFVYSHTDKIPIIIYIFGIVLTLLAVFFASSFRSARHIVHSDMDDACQKYARGTQNPLLKQWRVFIWFWVFILCSWFYVLIINYAIYLYLLLLIGFVVLLLMLGIASIADIPPRNKE